MEIYLLHLKETNKIKHWVLLRHSRFGHQRLRLYLSPTPATSITDYMTKDLEKQMHKQHENENYSAVYMITPEESTLSPEETKLDEYEENPEVPGILFLRT
eukprot:6200146-Amphidinium_carterae.1